MDQFLRIFNQAGDAVWAVDGRYRIVAWNRAAQEILGYPPAEAVGMRCHDLLSGRDPEGAPLCAPQCTVMGEIRRGRPVRCFDLLARGQDGQARRVNVSVLGVPDPRSGRLGLLIHLARLVQHGPVWPPSLRVRLLGPTSVERLDGSAVTGTLWRRVKVRALLAFLALQRGCPVHRDVVLEALWPNLEYLAALHNLNTTVYNLRRSLEPDLQRGADSGFVRYDGDGLYLNGGSAHWLDVSAFETAVARARCETDPARAVRLYQEALALYRGDFLAGLLLALDLRWCWAERDRLREIHLSALEELGMLCEGRRRLQDAADLYLAVLAADPCRESACRRLIQLSMWQGDRSGALAHYRRLTRSLAEELGVEPTAETRRLVEQAAGAPVAPGNAPQVLARSSATAGLRQATS